MSGTKRKVTLGTLVGTVISPIPLVLASASAGSGHGDYMLAYLLCPYTMLSPILHNTITSEFLFVALIEFPLYGAIGGWAWALPKWRRKVIVITSVVHIVAFVLIRWNANIYFTGR